MRAQLLAEFTTLGHDDRRRFRTEGNSGCGITPRSNPNLANPLRSDCCSIRGDESPYLLASRQSIIDVVINEKGKPLARGGRKATGLSESARPPN